MGENVCCLILQHVIDKIQEHKIVNDFNVDQNVENYV
jgi:hypothetical protein